jgi:hypothetical protein
VASKPETTFISSVHGKLPDKETPHREKMNNPYRSGTADVWYSGDLSDLWVEYKFIVLPARGDTLILPDLSAQQKDWLDGRFREGRNVAVIVGCSRGGVLYEHRTWLDSMTTDEFRSRLLTKQELAQWLVSKTIRRADDPESTADNGASRNRGKQDRAGRGSDRIHRTQSLRVRPPKRAHGSSTED